MEQNNEISYLKSARCQDVYTDSSAEYVLPDYNGDVRRILYTGATVRPAGSFTGEGEVVYSGIVVYDVVYLDGDGTLSSVSFTSDYELTSKCPTDSLSGAYADTRVANFAVRPVGPRKISAKASLVATPHAVTEHTYAPGGDAFSDRQSPETLTRVANIHKSCVSETVEREYAEEVVHVDGAIADELSVIHAAIDPMIEEVENDGDEITVRGSFTLSLTLKNGDEAAYREQKKIPFYFSVNAPYKAAQLKLHPG